MARISLSHWINFVLLAAVLTLGWMLFERSAPRDDAPARTSAEDESPSSSSAPVDTDADAMHAISARLAAIDARLSAIERNSPATSGERTAPAAAQAPIDPRTAAIADRRLSAMFPDGRVDQEDMQRFHLALSSLPANEQIALTASMTQAINAGRVKLEK